MRANPGGRARRAGFFLLALPAIARAAVRVATLEGRLTLEELVERLRATAPYRLAPLRRRPQWLLASLDRLLPLLPPRRQGRCLKRSLYLLDLWSRCGLHPELHLGVRRAGQRPHEAHAWVTVRERPAAGSEGLATADEGYPEAFRF